MQYARIRLPLLAVLCACSLELGASTIRAQSAQPAGGGGTGSGAGSGNSLARSRLPGGPSLVQSTPFTWTSTPHDLGPVRIPVGPGGGWVYASGGGFQVRLVPSYCSDPTVEVILFPGTSGLPNKPERFLLQFPIHDQPPAPRALVLGFHPYSVSEKSVFNTELPYLCAQKGYLLLAPYGVVDTNFAYLESQIALDAILGLLEQYLYFDHQRVYTVGFSMGGCNAVSYAMRHQDKSQLRVAGVIDHTGTMDLVLEHEMGVPDLVNLFGGSPAEVPYNYERISPFRMLGGSVDPAQARVANLLHVPFYVHCNLDDPTTHLKQQTFALASYLDAQGANVMLDTIHGGATHAWSTLDMSAALSWIDDYSLPPDPARLDEYADQAGDYLYTSVLELPAEQVARYRVDKLLGVNAFVVQGTKSLDKLAFDLAAMGLSSAQTLYMDSAGSDETGDTYVLRGYANAPSSVTLFGILQPQAWSWSAATHELTVTPNSNGAYAQIVVVP